MVNQVKKNSPVNDSMDCLFSTLDRAILAYSNLHEKLESVLCASPKTLSSNSAEAESSELVKRINKAMLMIQSLSDRIQDDVTSIEL